MRLFPSSASFFSFSKDRSRSSLRFFVDSFSDSADMNRFLALTDSKCDTATSCFVLASTRIFLRLSCLASRDFSASFCSMLSA